MKITYDPLKRSATLRDRGLDFEDATKVFAGVAIDIPDDRFDYGETRTLTVGQLRGRMVIVVWKRRGNDRRIISMRNANAREQARFRKRFGEG